jgi:membrane-bound lytic murein transglycosylase B
LLAALKIVQRGDLPLRDLISAFAGEIDQTQFCRRPTSNTASISTATAMSTCATACRTCWPPPPTCYVSGFKTGAPYGEGTANFEAMREWNRATIYRKTIGYFADRLGGR